MQNAGVSAERRAGSKRLRRRKMSKSCQSVPPVSRDAGGFEMNAGPRGLVVLNAGQVCRKTARFEKQLGAVRAVGELWVRTPPVERRGRFEMSPGSRDSGGSKCGRVRHKRAGSKLRACAVARRGGSEPEVRSTSQDVYGAWKTEVRSVLKSARRCFEDRGGRRVE